MSMRTEWTGGLVVPPGLTLYIDVIVAKEKYAGKADFKEVCSCHHKPFSAPKVCAVSGDRRKTVVGKTVTGTVEMVKAVANGEAFAPVDEAAIKAIEDSVNSDTIECLAYMDRAELPIEAFSDPYFVRPKKGLPNALEYVGGLYQALDSEGKALIARWGNRGRLFDVAIYPAGGVLYLTKLRYAQETKSPDGEVLSPSQATVMPGALDMLKATLASELPDNFNLAEREDESTVRKMAVIAQALTGKLEAPTTTTTAPAPASQVPDLMAALEASIQAGKSKPAKKATTKKEAVKA